jgi:hypothetical protein
MTVTDDDEIEDKTKTGGLPCAKTTSKFAQVFAATWIVVLTILKGFGIIKLPIEEIIYSGVSIAAIFMPVYFLILLEKIRDIRFGKTSVDGS